jgi:CRISPR-associated endonuclease/helicase Cas3
LTAGDDLPFRVVQLRGQVVDDREWSFDPSCPTLIIGTVDQIGSRLLFQGYGLGKRDRPMHAGLFGVDAWLCVDEAHLVPAFVIALRQLRQHIASAPAEECPATLATFFNRLPWWMTELSATPGLPAPASNSVLTLTDEDEAEPVIAQRIMAARTKRVHLIPCDEKSLVEKIVERALEFSDQRKRIAIYVRKPGDARKICHSIASTLRDKAEFRTLCITGRLRGVDRDRLADQAVFAVMSTDYRAENPITLGRPDATVFLVGTSAAEVGVDTDADAVLCDFAPMDTLLQRLGRMDRLGAVAAAGGAVVMEVFTPAIGDKLLASALEISRKLLNEGAEPSAELMVAHHWRAADPDEINQQATHSIAANQADPSRWRHEPLAPASVTPVLVQPLTPALLEFWSATSFRPSLDLPVQPWLYGYKLSEESTPLVGIIFRHELDYLEQARRASETSAEKDEEEQEEDAESDLDPSDAPSRFEKASRRVCEILDFHAPAKAEAHWVPLSLIRQWLRGELEDGQNRPASLPKLLAWKADDIWSIRALTDVGAKASLFDDVAACLRAEEFILLPTTAEVPKKIFDELSASFAFSATADVADHAWGDDPQPGSPWLRRSDGSSAAPFPGFVPSKEKLTVRLADGTVTLQYFVKSNAQSGSQMHLDVHHRAAAQFARGCLSALAGEDSPLVASFRTMGDVHDSGKDDPLWQWPVGNRTGPALAKYGKPVPPAAFQGYRHEWASRTKRATTQAWETLAPLFPPEDWPILRILFLHVIGSHHGHLRPSLPPQPHVQPTVLQSAIQQAARDWHRLQNSLGPWRLAYLEALLKAADTLASRDGTEITHVDQL